EALDALLGMRVCDPAMGSGHFLVDATEWLTEQIIVRLDGFPGNPVFREIAAMRAHIVEDLREQGIAIDPERLKDAHLLRRLVVKRCIYGVDLNPMAVELAQLSLWLDSFTYGAPLSFLDHHLKAGNSLLGTTLPAARKELSAGGGGQIELLGSHYAAVLRVTGLMTELANASDSTFDEAVHSSELYREIQREIAPDRALLDAWTSRLLGNGAARGLVLDHGGLLRDAAAGGKNPFGKGQRATLERARALACEHRFFHWDLEFPEIFYDPRYARLKDDPGFDVVIGNPPYVRQEQVGAIKPYLAAEYAAVHDGAADLYVYFHQKGLALLRGGGRLSYIITNKWLRAGYGERLRGHVAEVARVERIVDFGHAPVFSRRGRLSLHRPAAQARRERSRPGGRRTRRAGLRRSPRGAGNRGVGRVRSRPWLHRAGGPLHRRAVEPGAARSAAAAGQDPLRREAPARLRGRIAPLRDQDRAERGLPDRYRNQRPSGAGRPGERGAGAPLPARAGRHALVAAVGGAVDGRAVERREPPVAVDRGCRGEGGAVVQARLPRAARAPEADGGAAPQAERSGPVLVGAA
ncbi:MAG TPA: Eco57I restriction-modification methylase domain-containing protein, partial [Longimicrobium sp.]